MDWKLKISFLNLTLAFFSFSVCSVCGFLFIKNGNAIVLLLVNLQNKLILDSGDNAERQIKWNRTTVDILVYVLPQCFSVDVCILTPSPHTRDKSWGHSVCTALSSAFSSSTSRCFPLSVNQHCFEWLPGISLYDCRVIPVINWCLLR